MCSQKDIIKKYFLFIITILLFAFAIPIYGESVYGANYNNVNIPDNNTWVNSAITISGAPADATVIGIDAYFKCIHPYSGDLNVDINDQGITRNYDIWQNEGGSADNPTRTVYNISTFNGLAVNGTWRLYAKDTASGASGYIDEWWIRIYYTSKTYAVYGVIDSLSYGTDADGDGYYETYTFRVGVDGDVSSGSASIYAKVICPTTGQSWWSSSPWTITGTAIDYHYFSFNQADFAGHITANTNLDFTVELWDSTKTTRLATDTTITGEPVKVDPPTTYAVYGVIDSLSYGTDADGDGYYETYTFRVGVDGDVSSGSASIYAKVICLTTGQSWWFPSPWPITGNTTDYHYLPFSQADFEPYITGNTNLDFAVEIWNSTKTTRLAWDDTMPGEPIKADYIISYGVYGKISNLVYGTDADGDGYYETYTFTVGVDGNVSLGSVSIYAKIICPTTGQSWWSSSPWTITGNVTDYHYFPFNQANFEPYITGNTNLDFTVEIWNSTKTTRLATDTTITGEPLKVDFIMPATVTVYGTMRYLDSANNLHPIRYAKVEVINDNFLSDDIYTTNTDGNGNYSIRINNIDSDGSGADILVNVYTESLSGAYTENLNGVYPRITSSICSVRENIFTTSWYMVSSKYDNNIRPSLQISLTASSQDRNAGAFAVYDSIVEAFIKTLLIYKKEMPVITVWWPGNNSSYDPSSDQITLLRFDRWDRDVILHEYGHYIQDKFGFQDGSVGTNSNHWFYEDLRSSAGGVPFNRSNEEAMNLAFREAWPTFFAISVQLGNTGYPNSGDTVYQNTENVSHTVNLENDSFRPPDSGEYYEIMNLCILWDIFDNGAESFDTLYLSHNPIWNVASTIDKPDNLIEFWKAWFTQYAYNRAMTRIFLEHRISFIAQAPTGPNPPDGSNNQPLSLTLDWNDSANASSYDVYLGTARPPAYLGTTNTSSYPVSSLSYGQTYYWRIIAKGGNAEAEGPVWAFTTLPRPGTLSVSPIDGLSSSGAIGGPFSPSTKTYTLSNIGNSSISWTASKTVNWLSLSSTSGTLAAGASITFKINVNTNANTLAKGTYSDNVIFKNVTNNLGNTSRSISLNVAAPTGGYLSMTPADGLFSSGKVGGPFYPNNKMYTLKNNGTLSINWTVSKTVNWLSISPVSGSLAPGASASVKVSLNSNANTLAQGNYNSYVNFTNSTNKNGNTTRPISLIVSPNSGALAVDPLENFVSSGIPGGQFTPAYKTYTLTNTGEIPVDWIVSKTNPWLTVSESSGTLLPGSSQAIIISIDDNVLHLSDVANVSYNDTIVFTNSTNGNGNTNLAVALKVNNPHISSLSTDHGPVGTHITISGVNFDTNQGTVTFNGSNAVIKSWSDIEIETIVPRGASTGPVVVQVAPGRNSNGVNFAVINSHSKNQADLNGDGKTDILWRYYGIGGYNTVWLSDSNSNPDPTGGFPSEGLIGMNRQGEVNVPIDMNEYESEEVANVTMAAMVEDPRMGTNAIEITPEPDINWQLCGTGDFNNDGKTDLVWQNTTNGCNAVWYMDGLKKTGIGWLPTEIDLNWKLCGTGDFNNDGKIDIVWQNLNNGQNTIWYMDGLTRTGIGWLPSSVDANWRLCGTGDFNNDGKVDIVWRRVNDAQNLVWYMNGVKKIGTGVLPHTFDINWNLCGTGDFDNDGKVDLLWRNTIDGRNAIWYLDGIRFLRGEYLNTISNREWAIEN
ncbi:MAG TPA: FG-GAP-like repeat-containing protein [Candidatus Deferrimicrobium sp.]|nr:FG-GAP-like repeat-containing protein [Candidatus Deferrimicrobium sp.]